MRFPAPLRRISLIARILIMVGTTLALAYPVSVFLFTQSELAFYRATSEHELTVALDTLEKSIGEQAVIGDYALIEQILHARVRRSHFIEIDYSDVDGNVVTVTAPQPVAVYPAWFRSWFDLPDRPIFRAVVVGGKEYGQITVWMSHVEFRNQIWGMMLQQVALVAGVGIILFVAIAWVLRRSLIPLRTATELALGLRRGEYQCLAYSPWNAAPEIRDTLATFNDAATREAWFARFAEIISSTDTPVRKVRSVLALLCARLDMQGAVLAYQTSGGEFAVKTEYFAHEQAEKMEWEIWAARVAGRTPFMTNGHASAMSGLPGREPMAYLGVPVHMAGYQGAVLSLFGKPSDSLARHNGELELMGLCAEWIGTTLSQAEYDQRMREQKEHAESVLNGVMEGIVTLDHHGVIISANPAMAQIFRFPADWIVGQPLNKFLPAIDWSNVESRMTSQGAQTADAVWREEGRRNDGETILMEVSAHSVRRGDFGLAVVVLRDVTERIRAEEALQRSEARRRRAQEVAQLGSLEYFPATGRAHWSMELRHIFGVPGEDRPDFQDFLLRVNSDDRARVAQAFEHSVKDSHAFKIEFGIVRPDRKVRHVVLSAEAPERDEQGVKLFAVVQDVTERKQADAQVQAALVEKLQAEAHNRAKSLFLANMSHELRTPLNAILGYSDMLEEDARAEGREAAVSDLQKIQSAGRHLLAMINEVLDLAKIEAGKLDLLLEDCSARLLIQDALATIEPLAGQNGNRLHVDCMVGDEVVHTDAMKFKQVLINLLGNACKFTRGGEIKLFARREWEDGREWLRATVEDNGIGMTPEQLDRLFVPFVQADASTARKFGGTGLGLAISKRFIDMLGGDITVVSEPDRGAIFSLRIPVDGPAVIEDVEVGERVVEAATNRTADNHAGERRSRVATALIVENDHALRELMERYLSGEGFRVVSAASGKDLHMLVQAHRPALIVLDMELPELASADAIGQIASPWFPRGIPVILLGSPSQMQEARALGAVDYLTKPLNWPMLAAVSKKWARAGGAHLGMAHSPGGRVVAGKPGA